MIQISIVIICLILALNMQAELDRFCNAMIAIREEIKDIEEGRAEKYVHFSVKLPPAAMLSQTGANACPGTFSHSALLYIA